MNPEKDTVRFGLIGCGAWGSQHARAIAKTPGAQFAAIAEPSEPNRAAAQAAHPGAAFYADYREMLQREKLDVVDIVLPPHLHYEGAKAALGRRLPCAVGEADVPAARPMRRTDCPGARRQQRHLAIGHEFRLSSLWGRMKEMVDEGAIGDPRYCLIELWRNPYRQGTGGWRYNIKQVGNWILEEPIHFFDLARWYFSKAGRAGVGVRQRQP